TVGVGDPEEVEEERRLSGEALVQPPQPVLDSAARLGIRDVRDLEIRPQKPEHGQERNATLVGLRGDLEDRHPAGGAALGDLEAEPALADPRLAHDSDQLPAPGETRVDGALERAKLLVAADQRSQAARAGDLDWALFRLDPLQLEGLHLTHTLDLAHRRLPQPDVAPDERRGARGEADPSRSGRLLHSLGEADRVPDRRVGHVAALADGPDDDLARVEPDPDRELEAVCALEL